MTAGFLSYLKRIDPRIPVAVILFTYLVLGLTVLGFNRSPEQILITTALCCSFEMIFHRLFYGTWIFPLSAMITSFSLSFLLNYSHFSWMILLPPLLGIGSKYVFRLNNRHFFNPALFAVSTSLIFSKDLITAAPAYQWNGIENLSVFIVMLGLLFVIPKVNRGWLVISFLITFTLETALRAYIMRYHLPFETLFLGTISSPSFFIFTFFMITDPATSPNKKSDQIIVGISIAMVDLAYHLYQSYYTFFYAALTVAGVRFVYFHLKNAYQKGFIKNIKSNFVFNGYWKQLATITVLLVIVYQSLIHSSFAMALNPKSGFRFQKIQAQQSGLSADSQGDLFAKVDARVQHIVKWLLAETEGIAIGDFDGDGLQDIFLAQPLKEASLRSSLYRNIGNDRFERLSIPTISRVIEHPETYGIISNGIFVDYDNDGDQDLFLTVVHGSSILLKNLLVEKGKFEFQDVSEATGLAGFPSQSISATFADFNQDGLLDLFVANALEQNIPDYDPAVPLNLFHLPPPVNKDDQRMFNFMHASWNLANNGGHNQVFLQTPEHSFVIQNATLWGGVESRWSLSVGVADFNHDSWPDIYVANDFGPDELYYNQQGKGFESIKGRTFGSVGKDTYKGMNVSIADFDRTGWLGVYVSNVHHALQAEGSLLWQFSLTSNSRYPEITETATKKGVLNEERFGWGASATDFNNDGWVDLAQANGMVDDTYDKQYEECPDYWYINEKIARSPPTFHRFANKWGDIRGYCIFGKEKNRLLMNRGNLLKPQFVDIADFVGMDELTNSRAAVTADFSNSGRRDLIFTHPFSKPTFYKNVEDSVDKNQWAGLILEGNGKNCNRDAIGTYVQLLVKSKDGSEFKISQELQTVSGLLSQSDRRLHFGLGPDPISVTASVRWCGTKTETFELEMNSYLKRKQL